MALLQRSGVLEVLVLLLLSGGYLAGAATVTVNNTNAILGQSVTVTCTADTTSISLTYQWFEGEFEVQNGPSPDYRVSTSVGIGDAGDKYQCVVLDGDMEIGRTRYSLNVTIPGFTWQTKRDPDGDHYVGQRMSISCLGFLSSKVGLTANASILDQQGDPIPAGSEGDRVRFFDLQPTNSGYESRLEFSALSAGDAGMYQCTGTVMPTVPNPYVSSGVESLNFDIALTPIFIDMGITVATPLTRLLDSSPYNLLNLTCRSQMRVRVTATPFNVTFSWWQSVIGGQMQAISPGEFTGATGFGSDVSSQLSTSVSEMGSHTYSCQVSLDLRPAPDSRTQNTSTAVTAYGPSPPNTPINLTTPIVQHDKVTVQWTVPVVTYDPEMYLVSYGTTMAALMQNSDVVTATRVELTGLQVSTRYYFMVQATNSNGTSISDTQTFTTTALPPSPPSSLAFTQSDTNLTQYQFTWELDEDPLGVVTKQKVTCMPSAGSDATPLSVVVERDATSASVSGFVYLVEYVCEVQAAANDVYSLSSNSVSFQVTERVPDMVRCGSDGSPTGRFSDVFRVQGAARVSVSISWAPPADPRGILRTYTLTFMKYSTESVIRQVVVDASVINYTFTNLTLEDGVPYNVSLEASNSIATKSPPCFITDFSKQLAPPPVMDLKLVRSSKKEIKVTWTVVSLELARGFVEYLLEYAPATPTSVRRRRQVSGSPCTQSPCTVPASRGQATLVNLDPSKTYTVNVSPVNEDGVTGTLMSATDDPIDSGSTFPLLPVIIGVAVGTLVVAVLVLCVIIIACCCVVKRRKWNPSSSLGGPDHMELDHKEVVELSQEQAPLYAQPLNTLADRIKPLPVEYFSAHVKVMHENRDKLFDQEYESLSCDSTSASDIAKMNKAKNRFQNIYPYDFSRVKIEPMDGVEGSDYINASYIDGYGKPNAYIAAQGPMATTVSDFWRMIYEQKINTVVMLTKFNEGGKRKCEQYWPEGVGDEQVQKDTSLQVTYKELVAFADFEIRKFEVRNISEEDGCSIPLLVTHYQFLGWPDHGVPKFATSLIQFIRRVKKEYQRQMNSSAPLLVHCSAGVGRTGTFITLDAMLDRMVAEDSITVFDFVRNMRAKRVLMVQAANQYVFIHDALEELITCGDTSVEAPRLRDGINDLNIVNPDTTNTGFEDQFELLKNVSRVLTNADRSDALQHYNERKNRIQEIVPNNQSRVKLRATGDQGSDYINASFVDGYKHRNAYIASQAPLENTVHDFWRMIWEFGCRAIILLGPLQEGNKSLPMFWPEKENVEDDYGKVTVTLKSERQVKGCMERKINIRGERAVGTPDQGFVVTFYHYDNWPECGRPLTPASILHLNTSLGHCQRTTGNKPITVMCSDGIGRTGCFLAIHAMIERVNTENVIDFFQFIKSSRVHRADLVLELEHYRFCHDILADYIENNKSYANFKDFPASNPGSASMATPTGSSSYSNP